MMSPAWCGVCGLEMADGPQPTCARCQDALISLWADLSEAKCAACADQAVRVVMGVTLCIDCLSLVREAINTKVRDVWGALALCEILGLPEVTERDG